MFVHWIFSQSRKWAASLQGTVLPNSSVSYMHNWWTIKHFECFGEHGKLTRSWHTYVVPLYLIAAIWSSSSASKAGQSGIRSFTKWRWMHNPRLHLKPIHRVNPPVFMIRSSDLFVISLPLSFRHPCSPNKIHPMSLYNWKSYCTQLCMVHSRQLCIETCVLGTRRTAGCSY